MFEENGWNRIKIESIKTDKIRCAWKVKYKNKKKKKNVKNPCSEIKIQISTYIFWIFYNRFFTLHLSTYSTLSKLVAGSKKKGKWKIFTPLLNFALLKFQDRFNFSYFYANCSMFLLNNIRNSGWPHITGLLNKKNFANESFSERIKGTIHFFKNRSSIGAPELKPQRTKPFYLLLVCN